MCVRRPSESAPTSLPLPLPPPSSPSGLQSCYNQVWEKFRSITIFLTYENILNMSHCFICFYLFFVHAYKALFGSGGEGRTRGAAGGGRGGGDLKCFAPSLLLLLLFCVFYFVGLLAIISSSEKVPSVSTQRLQTSDSPSPPHPLPPHTPHPQPC